MGGIVSSEIVINRIEGDQRKIRELHIDSLDDNHFKNYYTELGADVDALLAQHAAEIFTQLKEQEVQQWIQGMEDMEDPAHIDMGGWFEHSVPEFETWENCLDGSLKYFLSQVDMQEILKCDLTCSRLTNKELQAVAGKPNDVRSEQSIALNTQTELDAYIPLIDNEGNPRP